MSRGTKLQEMEVKTQQSKTAVNSGAKPGDPMPKLTTGGTPVSYEDLGGPTPENSKPDDDSNKLKTPGTTLKQVKDVVNKGAKPADPTPAGMKEEEETEGEVVAEEPAVEVDTSFLDSMTKKELLEWSEAQGWDLVNGKRKAAILADCKEIALGTFDGTPLA